MRMNLSFFSVVILQVDMDEEGIILPKLCEIGAVSITNLLVYHRKYFFKEIC